MADIKKRLSELQILYADNTTGNISPNDLRDGFKTVVGSMNIISTSANITASADDIVFDVDTNFNDVTITIPSASASDGSGGTYKHKVFYFINNGLNNIILSGPGFTVPSGENLSIISNGISWLKLTKSGETTGSLNDLNDVIITSPAEGQTLVYDGTDWTNQIPVVYVDVKNGETSTITRGQPVYISSSTNGGTPIVKLADNDGVNTYPAIGLVADNTIDAGNEGRVLISGILENLNTSAYSVGDAVYLDSNPGVLTNIRPILETKKVQKVGLVTRTDDNAGRILVIGAGRTNDVPNELTALTGVPLNATDLGTFTGSIISDNQNIKDAFQDTINAIENSGQVDSIISSDGNIDIDSTIPTTPNINLLKFPDNKLFSDVPSTYPNGYSYGLNTGTGGFPDPNGTHQTFKANDDTGYQIFTATTSFKQWQRTIIAPDTWSAFTQITTKSTELSISSTSAMVTETADFVFVDYTSAGPVTLTISNDWINGRNGATLVVKDSGISAGTNNITINTEGLQLIDGNTVYVIDSNAESISIHNRGGTLYLY